MRRHLRGFTILELLVVVAIIAVLAMIALPNFIGRIDEAKASQNLAEINAVTTAVNTYYADNGNYPTLQGKDGTLLQPQPIMGSPHNIDFSSLVPDYLAKLPHFSYWWVDYEGKVYHTQESVGTVAANVFTPTTGYEYTLHKADGSTQVLSAPYTLQAGDYIIGTDANGIDLPKVSNSFKNALMHPESPEYALYSGPQPLQMTVPIGWIGVSSLDDLDNMRNNLSGKYILMKNLDFNNSDSYVNQSYKTTWTTGLGWLPVGVYNQTAKFVGSFDGNGLSIDNLYINRSNRYVGLFSYTDNATIKNLTLNNVYVSSSDASSHDGGLVGWADKTTTIYNIKVTGSVIGKTTGQQEGGIVGCLSNGSTLSQSISGVNVGGISNMSGSLVGYVNSASINNSYSYGNTTSTNAAGGLVGWSNSSNITNVYSIGKPVGATIGGLLYSKSFGGVTSSYWDTTTSSTSISAGGTGKTTAQMKQKSTYVGWDFTNIWTIVEGSDYPRLKWETR